MNEEIEELQESATANQLAIDEYGAKLSAAVLVIEHLVRLTCSDGRQALSLAKNLDGDIERRLLLTRNEEDKGTMWLMQLRDDLVSWFQVEPEVRAAIARGELRQKPLRERLRVIDSDSSSEGALEAPQE